RQRAKRKAQPAHQLVDEGLRKLGPARGEGLGAVDVQVELHRRLQRLGARVEVGTLGDQRADQVTGAHVPDRQLPAVRPRHVVPKEARHDQRRRGSVASRKDDAARGVVHRRRAFDELGRDGRRQASYEPPAWDVVQLDAAQSRSASAAPRRGLHLHLSYLLDYTSYHSIYLFESYE